MLKELQKEELELVNLKVSKADLAILRANAKKYTATDARPEGNLSLWLRYAGMNHTPPKSDLAPTTKKKNKKK